MYLLSIDGISVLLIAILNKILTSNFPYLDKARIGLESNIDHIHWWTHTRSSPLSVFTDLIETISNRYVSDIALRIGDAAQLTDLGMMGYAMLNSSNLERAIRIACQALDEVNYPVKASLVSQGDYTKLGPVAISHR